MQHLNLKIRTSTLSFDDYVELEGMNALEVSPLSTTQEHQLGPQPTTTSTANELHLIDSSLLFYSGCKALEFTATYLPFLV